MDPRHVEDSLLSRQYAMQHRITDHPPPSVVPTLQRGDQAAPRPPHSGGATPRPPNSGVSHRQVMVGDRLMVMNEAGGLDDPHGLCESIIPEHIHIKRPMNAFMCWAQVCREF